MKIGILGAGLAGLSCASELAKARIPVAVIEKDPEVGGIAKSFVKGGFVYDLGPHRFHTKDEHILNHIRELLHDELSVKTRKSAIHLKGQFFEYPLKTRDVLMRMPPGTILRILFDYAKVKLQNYVEPHPDDSFEAWVVNRYGETLYRIFFGEYTEKVWGLPCTQISADWAAQRISLLSLWDAIKNTLVRGKDTPRTYVSEFYYPQHGGIGAISREYERQIKKMGGQILLNSRIQRIHQKNNRITDLEFTKDGKRTKRNFDRICSTIPLTTLVELLEKAPEDVYKSAEKLAFRSIIFTYIVLDRPMLSKNHWIYLPEKQFFTNRISEIKNFSENNAPKEKTILCGEITCSFDDHIWKKDDEELISLFLGDMIRLGLMTKDSEKMEDTLVYRIEHAYPIYDLDYKRYLDTIKTYLDQIENLYYFGRNALFRYNNMDHSIDMGLKVARNLLGEGLDYRSVATGQKWFG